jgi:hypothetical protein
MDESIRLLGHPDIELPLRVTDARRGVGSFLVIELHAVNLSVSTRPDDALSLWIYLCDWAICEGDCELLNSDCTETSAYSSALAKLVGHLLESASVADLESCEFVFSNGIRLSVDDASDIYGDEKELVMIFRGRQRIAAFRSGAGLQIGS